MELDVMLDTLFSGRICLAACFVSLIAAILVRLDTMWTNAKLRRELQISTHRLGHAECNIRDLGDEVSHLAGDLRDLRLTAEDWQPTTDRLGIDARGVG